jgi:prepilin peptidase CpaA
VTAALSHLCAVVYLAGLVAAAGWDLASYTIPNRLVAAVALAGAAGLGLVAPDFAMPARFLLTAFAVLFAGGLLFAVGIWGAGDAKLLAAAALVAGPHGLPVLLEWTALAGGGLSLSILILRRLQFVNPNRRKPGCVGFLSESKGVPYGVAIAVGGIVAYSAHATVLTSW